MTYQDDVGGRVARDDLIKAGGLEAYYAFTVERALELLARRAQPLAECRGRVDRYDLIPIVRLFYVFDDSTWLIADVDADSDTAYGCVQVKDSEPQIAEFSLAELAERRWGDHCAINLDPDFRTEATLKHWLARSCEVGSILSAEPDLNLNWGKAPGNAAVSEFEIGSDQPRSLS